MASPIADILRAFAKEYTGDAKKLEALVVQYLADGLSPKDAVDTAIAKLGFFGKVHEAIQTTMVLSCAAGNGGTIPLIESLASPWDGSGMTLSQKLHGADMNMRKAIIGTIKEQLKLGTHARSVALELYDGYNSGKHVVRHQELPKYLKGILSLAQKGELSKQEKLHLNVLIDQAREQVAQLGANGAPNQALKAAYSQLLDAVEKGAEKALANGIKVAAEEKSRYVAERIARTEAARAWAQGFVERYGDDDEVSCYQWKLSSRHPFTDICDMYANANLWGLGKGIFPKDKCPALPAHPHCLCHLAPVYAVEVDASDSHDRVKQGGDEWLASLSYGQRCTVLGVSGAKAWEQGHSDWRQYMRGWTGAVLKGIHGGNNVANGENSGIINMKGEKMVQSEKYDMPLAKIKDFLLKPDAKHSREFFDVGYTPDDTLRLNSDIEALFDEANAQDRKVLSDGAQRFSIFMDLGIGIKKSFRTVWQRDTADARPRFITAHREDREDL